MVREETKEVCDEAAEEGRAMMGPSAVSSSVSLELPIVAPELESGAVGIDLSVVEELLHR